MSADYRVDIAIGPTRAGITYNWSIERGDAPSLPEVLDGLTIGYQFSESNLWPTQPEPVTAALSIVAEDAADVAGIDRGTQVIIRVWAGVVTRFEEDSATFVGRVADATGRPIRFGHPTTGDEVNGWLLELQCVDPVPDLAEHTVAGYFLTISGVHDNIDGRFDLAGVTPPKWDAHGNDGGGDGTPLLVLNDGLLEPTDLLSATDSILAAYADGGTITGPASVPTNHAVYRSHGWRRGVIRPNVDTDAAIDPDEPWRVEWVSRRHGQVLNLGTPSLPAVFANLGGGVYGLKIEAPPPTINIGGEDFDVWDGSIVIDADYLSYDATWTRTKFDDPNTVTVANNAVDALWTSADATNRVANEAVVAATITDSLASEAYDAASVAQMYLDDSANADVVWSASGFRWYASRDPQWPVMRSLFPEAVLFGEYSAPIVITGIPANQRPDSRPWYVGVPRAVQWTFEGGEFVISFDLDPRTPRPRNEEHTGLTWAELAADFPAVTWNDLDPSQTWIDARLARTTFYYA